mmetsp:Transcript_17835/g.25113  ORF Transcript_17835/g.25113 Transcript_17835/m.25113 type:complete len:230 (-) Transcript_17835:725-1414(-)
MMRIFFLEYIIILAIIIIIILIMITDIVHGGWILDGIIIGRIHHDVVIRIGDCWICRRIIRGRIVVFTRSSCWICHVIIIGGRIHVVVIVVAAISIISSPIHRRMIRRKSFLTWSLLLLLLLSTSLMITTRITIGTCRPFWRRTFTIYTRRCSGSCRMIIKFWSISCTCPTRKGCTGRSFIGTIMHRHFIFIIINRFRSINGSSPPIGCRITSYGTAVGIIILLTTTIR